jgi:hypothetical protein
MKYSPFSTFSISGQTFIVAAQVISLQREMLNHQFGERGLSGASNNSFSIKSN